jgi:hypothetical protein
VAESFIGKTIEITGTPTQSPDGKLYLLASTMQLKLASEQRQFRPQARTEATPAPAISTANPVAPATAATRAPAATPVALPSPTAKPAGVVPPGTPLMIRFLEPVDLLNPNEATYRGRIERAIVSGRTAVVAAGSTVVVKAVQKRQPDSRLNVVYVALTVESILQNGSTIPITTLEVLKPAPVPGTQYRGAPIMPAQTVLFFTVSSN